MSEKLPRPGQVTLAGWLIVGGSLGVLVTVYEQLARLHSLDTREAISKTLDDPALKGLDVGVGAVLDAMHVLGLIAGACAAAAIVLGWHVLRRHQASRVALTILAVPLLLAGVASGGFFSSIVAVAVVLLWVPQARDWFRGVPAATRSPSDQQSPPRPPARPDAPPTPRTPGAPVQRSPQAPPTPWPAQPHLGRPDPRTPRPGAVLGAAVLTWILCALGVVVLILSGVLVSADPKAAYDEMLRESPELRGQGITQGMVVAMTWVAVVMGVAVCAFTAVVAHLALRGIGWARVTLIALVSVAVAVLLIATVLVPPLVVALGIGVVALALLLRPEARAWFRR